MSAGNAVLDVMFKKNFLNDVKKKGIYFKKELEIIQKNFPNIIKEVRGKGLLMGLVINKDQNSFINKLLNYKLLTVKASENVVRLLPPLNVTKKEINLALKIIKKVCETYK